ncbi:MAG: hypothetical protein IJJ43_00285 [Oscillospiraceae bacterium]|nr:hypothetical protein [Oscillospiraceae bacterium]
MYEFTVPMALFDFVPVILFAVSGVLLQRDLYNKMPKYAFACFAAGTVNIFMAGFLKALWKLLYALGACDFAVFNTMFLPLQSLGFLLAGLGIVIMFFPKKKAALAVAAPPVFKGTFVFIGMMVAGLGAVCACLSVVAARMKKKGLIVVFALCFVVYMGMGYLGSRDSSSAAANWLEQGVNTLGQLLLLLGVGSLHKAGLRDFKLS